MPAAGRRRSACHAAQGDLGTEERSWHADVQEVTVRVADSVDVACSVVGSDLCRRLRSDEGWDTLVEVLGHMLSNNLPREPFEALLDTNRPALQRHRCRLPRLIACGTRAA
jgi:hypothetical protein